LILVGLVTVALATGGFVVYSHAGANPGCTAPAPPATCTRVFFLGNSYTAVNDLPFTFAALAWAGGHRVDTAVVAPGGWTLVDHSTDPQTQQTLSTASWTWVVLQEQSEIPSERVDRDTMMYPASRDLVRMVRAAGAQPIFFETWAHRDGWAAAGLPDYRSMQSAIDDAYEFIARDQHAALAPVGSAWAEVVNEDPDAGLWQGDGSHPTAKGTYLAACVFYAAVFRQSPVGLGYHPWISAADAHEVQQAAADTVFGLPTAAGSS
jgi:hypothetical protein